MGDERDKNQELSYEDVNMVKESAPYYGGKRQGEYTIEDYYALPDEQRVELIDGVFYDMSTPLSVHQLIVVEICHKLREYIERKKGNCIAFDCPVDTQLDCDNKTMVQPDVFVVCDRDKITRRGIFGAPDLVIEVLSKSTKKKDMFIKLNKYKNAGVREYWMVDAEKKVVLVYVFQNDDDVKLYGFDAKIPVSIFDGDCQIDFKEVYDYVKFLYDSDRI